jgi:hypothetical protein
MVRLTASTLLTVFSVLGFYMTASAADVDPTVPSVALGSDYFATQPGTFFNFGGGIGPVNFLGLPIGPFNTDTIIQRKTDAVLGGPAIPIQIVALSLKSAAPVNVGGSFFDVFVTLDPANLANDVGTMSIAGNTTTGGTFSSGLNVFFQAHFAPTGGGAPFDVFNQVNLTSSGTAWGPTPPAGSGIVNGPDDGTTPDQQANLHSGLICTALTGACEVDFFLPTSGTALTETTSTGNEAHIVRLAQTPEPGTMILLGAGLIAFKFEIEVAALLIGCWQPHRKKPLHYCRGSVRSGQSRESNGAVLYLLGVLPQRLSKGCGNRRRH